MEPEKPTKRINHDQVAVGDEFFCPQNSVRAPIGGRITKVKKVNLDYETEYRPRPGFSEILKLTTSKQDLVGGCLKRDRDYYIID